MKQRLMYYRLLDFIENDNDYHVALLTGIRRTGKTFLLRSLETHYKPNAVYIDLSEEGSSLECIQEKFDTKQHTLLLLDEIASVGQYELIAQALFDQTEDSGHQHKIIISGSSPAHLIKLSSTKLGCRSRSFRLPLLMFIEYLYFTNKITSYEDYTSVSNQDFVDYLQLKGLRDTSAANLSIVFDETYFTDFYSEVALNNRNSRLTNSLMDLHANDLTNFVNILAYKLSESSRYTHVVEATVGAQEHVHLHNQQVKVQLSKIDFTDTIIFESLRAVPGITIGVIRRILIFLLWSGIVTVEYVHNSMDSEADDIGLILDTIGKCETKKDLEALFTRISFCLISPLFYTRIGHEILERMNVSVDKLSKGMLFGKMLELYIRGSLSLLKTKTVLTSHKLHYIDQPEVDIWDNDNRILCECSSINKSDKFIGVYNYFKNHAFIRVCSSDNKDYFNEYEGYYQIPYAKLCCLIDTGDILNLKRTITSSTDHMSDKSVNTEDLQHPHADSDFPNIGYFD